MSRKPKTEQPIKETDAATTLTAEAPIETPAEPLPTQQPPAEQPQTLVDRLAERYKRAVRPDPFTIAFDKLAGIRLFESRRDGVMAIGFDEKPAQGVIDTLKEAAFRWNAADGVWTHPVRRESALATRIDAERLYQDVRDMIRQDKGIVAGPDIPF